MILAKCPKCDGTGRVKYEGRYSRHVYGYDEASGTVPCDNCGGQYMSLRATGQTRVDPATGNGCLHSYDGRNVGRCLTQYTCSKCGDRHDIDSSD